MKIKVFIFASETGKVPYTDWLDDLDPMTRAVIRSRIDRVRLGNLGDCKLLKNVKGIYELRVDYGPGYRIYFAKINIESIVLLIGGNKSSQKSDIEKAKRYWMDYEQTE